MLTRPEALRKLSTEIALITFPEAELGFGVVHVQVPFAAAVIGALEQAILGHQALSVLS